MVKQRQYTAVMALSIENIANWEVNISGSCSHIISVIEKKKTKIKNRKKIGTWLEPDSWLELDSRLEVDWCNELNKLVTDILARELVTRVTEM